MGCQEAGAERIIAVDINPDKKSKGQCGIDQGEVVSVLYIEFTESVAR